MIAKYPIEVYEGLCDRWSFRGYALGTSTYFPTVDGSEETNEDAVISYVVLYGAARMGRMHCAKSPPFYRLFA